MGFVAAADEAGEKASHGTAKYRASLGAARAGPTAAWRRAANLVTKSFSAPLVSLRGALRILGVKRRRTRPPASSLRSAAAVPRQGRKPREREGIVKPFPRSLMPSSVTPSFTDLIACERDCRDLQLRRVAGLRRQLRGVPAQRVLSLREPRRRPEQDRARRSSSCVPCCSRTCTPAASGRATDADGSRVIRDLVSRIHATSGRL